MDDPVELLMDVSRLEVADRGALLPAAAWVGAQVRSLAEAAVFDRFADHRPRALVVLATGRAAVDARVAVALLGQQLPFPVVVGPALPLWVGALDAVVALAPDGEAADPALVDGITTARRRGATVLVRASRFGPAAFAAGPDLYTPAIPVPEALAGVARMLVVHQAAVACGAGRPLDPAGWEALAQAADAEALADTPRMETFVNPAKELALGLLDRVPVLIGTEPVTCAVAAHGAAVLAELAGAPAWAPEPGLPAESTALLSRLHARTDIFADPDDTSDALPLRAVVLGLHPDAAPTGPQRSLVDGLAGALHTVGPEPTALGTLGAAVSLLVRLDFAAVYLGLLCGQVLPPDAPSGLAPVGAATHRLVPDTGRVREREDENLWN